MHRPLRILMLVLLVAAVAAAWWLVSRPQPVAVRVQTVERGLVEDVVANTRAAWDFVLLAEASAATIGLLAGVLPALQAARLDPIAALHDE